MNVFSIRMHFREEKEKGKAIWEANWAVAKLPGKLVNGWSFIFCVFSYTSAKQLKERTLVIYPRESRIEAGFGEGLRGDIQSVLCVIVLIWKK